MRRQRRVEMIKTQVKYILGSKNQNGNNKYAIVRNITKYFKRDMLEILLITKVKDDTNA